MDESCLVPIGRVVKTHGVRGALKIFSYGDTLGEIVAGEKLFPIGPDGSVEREITLVSLRPQNRAWLGEFEEITEIDQARGMAGKDLCVPQDRLPPLPQGEYYHFQLIGLDVETKEGRKVGRILSVLETGSNDVYVVECEGKELLIPALEDIVSEIDLPNKKMVVDLPEGLE